MQFDYVVTLKKSSEKQIDFISIFLCILSIVGFAYEQISSRHFNVMFSLVSLILAGGLLYNLLWAGKEVSPRYKYLLFLAGIAWIGMPFLQWVALTLFFLAFLEYQAKHPLEVGFTPREIVINSLIRKRFTWSDLNNVILKDGLLTIDCKNNQIFQKETLDEEEPDADEDEFNDYCQKQLLQAGQPAGFGSVR